MAADLGARQAAEEQIADRVAAAEGVQGQARVRISSFPFLGRLLLSGTVTDLTVAVGDVEAERLRFATVAVDLDEVRISRDELLSGRRVVLQDVGRGTARAEMTQEELSRLVGLPVTVEPGRVRVRLGGQQATATASVRGNVLRLAVAGVQVPSLTIPRVPLVPCLADLELLPGRVRLTCRLDQVPPDLVGRIQARI
ncbi:MAG: DUF2993 domain-containing protein [Actinomycetota bacterium]|nr:DUF2993 domain-containing protein [Actinomycetota bacterium]